MEALFELAPKDEAQRVRTARRGLKERRPRNAQKKSASDEADDLFLMGFIF
jgi:hypothetical protein